MESSKLSQMTDQVSRWGPLLFSPGSLPQLSFTIFSWFCCMAQGQLERVLHWSTLPAPHQLREQSIYCETANFRLQQESFSWCLKSPASNLRYQRNFFFPTRQAQTVLQWAVWVLETAGSQRRAGWSLSSSLMRHSYTSPGGP